MEYVWKRGEELGSRVSMKCGFKNFVFKSHSKVICGVNTSKGLIPCDNVFICAGVYTPYIL